MSALLALLLAQAAPVAQVQTSTAAVEAPAADRLAAARRVVDTVFPAAQREQMMAAMVGSTSEMVRGSVARQPDVAQLIEKEPRARPIFDRFLAKQQAKSVLRMQAGVPDMIEAMSRAYARRFTVPQLEELRAFFETPTGRAYVTQSATIMSDPDISAWQTKMMTDNLTSLAPDVREFVQELMALAPAGKAK